jgi:hypothetical protein
MPYPSLAIRIARATALGLMTAINAPGQADKIPPIKRGSAERLELLSAREQVGYAGDMASCPTDGGNPPFI